MAGKRPIGVTLLAIAFTFLGVVTLLSIPLAAAFASRGGVVNVGIGLVILLLPQVLLVAAYGLWRMRRWAWLLTAILLLASALSALAAAANFPPSKADAAQWFRFALSVVGLGYLTFPDVRRAFAAQPSA